MTHMPSTKCQYHESISTCSVCVRVTYPRRLKTKTKTEQGQTHDHMTGMQADQGIKGRAEKISGDREMIPKDQPVPFESGGTQEFHREENSDQPPEPKTLIMPRLKARSANTTVKLLDSKQIVARIGRSSTSLG